MQRKIVLFTYHNLQSKRFGFFHALAIEGRRLGYDVCMISFPRPILALLKTGDRFGLKMFRLFLGIKSRGIINVSFPSFGLPGLIQVIGADLYYWLQIQPKFLLKRFLKKRLKHANFIFIESNESVILTSLIYELKVAHAKVIYRVSDPLLKWGNQYLIDKEKVLLEKADEVLFTNKKAEKLYSNLDPTGVFKVVENGFSFPTKNNKKETGVDILYLGAASISWDLLFDCALAFESFNFTIITPSPVSSEINSRLKKFSNIRFIPGIAFEDTYGYIEACKLFIVPYEKRFSDMPLGLTSKYIQAMFYSKPILAFNDSEDLRKYGIQVADSEAEFIDSIDLLRGKNVKYDVGFSAKGWDSIIMKLLSGL